MSKKISKIKKNLIGLEIGSTGLKLVVGDFIKDEFHVRQVVINPLPEKVFVDGDISDIDLVAGIIKKAIKQHKIHARACFSCINSGQIITREVIVPNQNRDHVHDVAKYEVEQYLPVELENYLVQAITLREMEIDSKPYAEMLVTAFPKKMIAQMHTLITKSGLTPVVLDTQSNAFAKFVENQLKINGNDYHREGVTAFVDLGSEKINIQIFRQGKFGFSQIIPYGGRDLDTNISKFMDIPLEDAVRMKMQIRNMNYAVDELSDEAKLINVMKSTMTSWLDEVNKIFRYYRSRNGSTHGIDFIYIYGGLSNIPGICDFIESEFKVPTEKVKKVSSIELPKAADISDIMNTIGVFYRR